jgi:hypothetical protein
MRKLPNRSRRRSGGHAPRAITERQTAALIRAVVAMGFATVGFLVGLRFTLDGGSAIDIAYHLAALPTLLLTLLALLRGPIPATRGTTIRSNRTASS